MAAISSAEDIQPILHRLSLHWSEVETEIGRSFMLKDEYSRIQLDADKKELDDALDAIMEPDNEAERGAALREKLRKPLLIRFDEIKNAVNSSISNPVHAAALPGKPSPHASGTVTLKAFADLAELWGKINTDTTLPASERPLTVVGGYNRANFEADVAALKAAFDAIGDAHHEATQSRKDRDALVPSLLPRLTQYRARVNSLLPAGHRLLATLP